MKAILTKASDFEENPKEIEINNLDELLSLINGTEQGSVIIKTKEFDFYDGTKFVYKPLDVTKIMIYDDYIE